MKCPRCGFVSFPGVSQCKKCGYRLADRGNAAAPGSSPLEAAEFDPEAPQILASSVRPSPAADQPGTEPREGAPTPSAPAHVENPPSTADDSPVEPPANAGAPWSNEVTNRVANYRRRRSSPRNPAPPDQSLALDFDADLEGKAGFFLGSPRTGRPAPRRGFDAAFNESGERVKANIDSLPLLNTGGRAAPRPFPSVNAEAGFKEDIKPAPAPIQFLDSALPETHGIPASGFAEVLSAPLGKRFWAGVVDGLVLLAAGGLFALLFRVVGGDVRRTASGFVVVVSIAVFWLFVYFASFSAIALSTPGQSLMGLSLRNFDGELPSQQECFLRAFGYLVSIASMMLGFLWAAMDSDGLAWHDHISGTFLAERQRVSESTGQPRRRS